METSTTLKVLPFGARVRLSSVDENGYLGRELHPSKDDVGFLGVIVENFVMYSKGFMSLYNTEQNVPPGTLLRQDDMDVTDDDTRYEEVMYTVLGPDGRKLECMWFELEHIGSVLA